MDLLEFAISRALDIVAPLIRFQSKPNHAKWMTEEIKGLIKIRDTARDLAVQTGETEDWNFFKELRKEVRNKCNKEEYRYNKEHLSCEDSSTQWKRIKKFTGLDGRKKQDLEIEIHGEKVSDPLTTSNFMNKYFKSKVTKLLEELTPDVSEAKGYMEEYLENKKIGKFGFGSVSIKEMKRAFVCTNHTAL